MTTWVRRALVLSGLWMMLTLPIATGAQSQADHSEAKEGTSRSGANGELEREVILLDPLESPNEPEDRLVILPEIKRDGERYFLSSFKLPDKLSFAGQPVPLDNWQVRELPPKSSWPMPGCRTTSSICCWWRASAWPPPIQGRKRLGRGSSSLPPGDAIVSRATRFATIVAI